MKHIALHKPRKARVMRVSERLYMCTVRRKHVDKKKSTYGPTYTQHPGKLKHGLMDGKAQLVPASKHAACAQHTVHQGARTRHNRHCWQAAQGMPSPKLT